MIFLGFLWELYGISMKFLWNFYVNGGLWYFCGIPMGFPWYFYDISMIFLRDYYGMSIESTVSWNQLNINAS